MDILKSKSDKQLLALEKRLKDVYDKAYIDIINRNQDLLNELDSINKKLEKEQLAGLETKNTIKERNLTIELIKQTENIKENIAYDITNVGRLASDMINNEMLNVFSNNYIGTTQMLIPEIGLAFNVYDKNILKGLFLDGQDMFSKIALNNLYLEKKIMQQLSNELAVSIIAGEGIDKISKRIQNVINIQKNRATTIARTETTKAVSKGRQIGFDQAKELGIKFKKQWSSAHDGRTRETHRQLDGEVVENDKTFSNGLQYPGDSNGRKDEIINCRCAMIPILKDY